MPLEFRIQEPLVEAHVKSDERSVCDEIRESLRDLAEVPQVTDVPCQLLISAPSGVIDGGGCVPPNPRSGRFQDVSPESARARAKHSINSATSSAESPSRTEHLGGSLSAHTAATGPVTITPPIG